MKKCPKCENEMEKKGELANDSRNPDFIAVFFQCPECKNIEMEQVDVIHKHIGYGRELPKEHWPGRKR